MSSSTLRTLLPPLHWTPDKLTDLPSWGWVRTIGSTCMGKGSLRWNNPSRDFKSPHWTLIILTRSHVGAYRQSEVQADASSYVSPSNASRRVFFCAYSGLGKNSAAWMSYFLWWACSYEAVLLNPSIRMFWSSISTKAKLLLSNPSKSTIPNWVI